ncbi:YciI family protein [Mangrovimonas cancribranchiae]|uniref:YciI family protein n=1 Tax=Mangrovimonas cancribranchiae TaxID=3080055 RepID=A0AAU6NVM4_9FLAO
MKQFLTIFALTLFFMGCKDNEKASELKDFTTEPEVKENLIDTIVAENPVSEKSVARIKEELKKQGYQTFDYVNEKTGDTILMQQYFMVFLKSGPIRSQNEEEAAKLQEAHLAHLSRMYEEGYADISGPFGDDGDIRGITIYNVPTLKIADSLANLDPMVKSGRLVIEVHPWWAGKGFPLR